MRFFYVAFWTPIGPSAWFTKTTGKHILHPDIFTEFTQDAARKVTARVGGQLVDPKMILIQNVIELEPEVAIARFPEEFKDQGIPITEDGTPVRLETRDCDCEDRFDRRDGD